MAHDEIDDETLRGVVTGAADAVTARAVANWRLRSAANERRFQEVAAIAHVMTMLANAEEVPPPPSVAQLTGSASHSRWRVPRRSLVSAAIAAAVIAAVGLGMRDRAGEESRWGGEQFVAGSAETATIELRDSTVVRLSPGSRLRLLDRAGVRAVHLDGRAYFAVAKDARRPFVIQTSAGEVRVLGTRFDLETAAQDLSLLVVEGLVTVAPTGRSPMQVGAGEMSEVRAGRVLPLRRVANVADAVSWTGRFLAFQETPLREAIREVERTYGVSVRLEDRGLGDRTLTMWFADEPIENVLTVVCLVVEASCVHTGSVITIAPSRQPGYAPPRREPARAVGKEGPS
ncbi:MAG: FecR domain-containing protein [Cytophagaceae bacterium]|nr:FecR domain-containing protein [Gemmatimonadaceae bacterium]